jgi:hypothetical protein
MGLGKGDRVQTVKKGKVVPLCFIVALMREKSAASTLS